MDLLRELPEGNLVDYRKGQGEIDRHINAKVIGFAVVRLNTMGHTRLLCPLHHYVEHLLLKIDGDHSAFVANHFGHGNREMPQPQPTSMTVIPART